MLSSSKILIFFGARSTPGGSVLSIFILMVMYLSGVSYTQLVLAQSLPGGVVVDGMDDRDSPPPPPSWGITGRTIEVKVYLEGPYQTSTGEMRQTLRLNLLIPIEQPYNASPWNYAGNEKGTTHRHYPGMVDWVLLEFRDAPDAENATQSTVVKRVAAYLFQNGTLNGPDGLPLRVPLPGEPEHGYFLVVRHRNHIDIMSSGWLDYDEEEDTYSWDFTDAQTKAYRGTFQSSYKLIDASEGRYGMVAGDADADGNIFVSDFVLWNTFFDYRNTYNNSDFDFDTNVFVSDFVQWNMNFDSRGQVP
jgi:hypothetical protein